MFEYMAISRIWSSNMFILYIISMLGGVRALDMEL